MGKARADIQTRSLEEYPWKSTTLRLHRWIVVWYRKRLPESVQAANASAKKEGCVSSSKETSTLLCMLVGQLNMQKPLPGPARHHGGADSALLVSRAGLGNERWSVTAAMNKHDPAHLHEAGDCEISCPSSERRLCASGPGTREDQPCLSSLEFHSVLLLIRTRKGLVWLIH